MKRSIQTVEYLNLNNNSYFNCHLKLLKFPYVILLNFEWFI